MARNLVRAKRFNTDREIATELDLQLGLFRCFHVDAVDVEVEILRITALVTVLDGDYPGLPCAQ